jgi:hypothetical protein
MKIQQKLMIILSAYTSLKRHKYCRNAPHQQRIQDEHYLIA